MGVFSARSGAGGGFLGSCIPEFFGSLVLQFSRFTGIRWYPPYSSERVDGPFLRYQLFVDAQECFYGFHVVKFVTFL